MIALVLFTMLLDIIQLGLYFPGAQDAFGSGASKSLRYTHSLSIVLTYLYLLFQLQLIERGNSQQGR